MDGGATGEERPIIGRQPSRIERIIGGSVAGVALRLVVLSFLVGVAMSVLGIHLADIAAWIEDRVFWLTTMSFETVRSAIGYFLLGAAVVVPIWILWRIFRITRI